MKETQLCTSDSLTICPISQATLSSCVSIANSTLGDGYIPEKDFLNTDSYNICGVVRGEVVGLALGRIYSPEEFGSRFPKVACMMSESYQIPDVIGWVSSVAVRPDHQRRGIGRSLVQYMLRYFDNKQVSVVSMIGWLAPDGVHISGVARALGFLEKGRIADYWYEDSLSKGYSCPACGKPPCRCSAVWYVRQPST